MKKILALSILLSMVIASIPVALAEDPCDCEWLCCYVDEDKHEITTIANVVGSGGSGGTGGSQGGSANENAPIIKCKWEYDEKVQLPLPDPCCWQYHILHDACPFEPGLQVQLQPGIDTYVGYYAIVTDPQGRGHIDHVYADIWHPNGEFKYQIELFPVGFDQYGNYDKQVAIDKWNHVKEKHESLVKYSGFLPHDPEWTQEEDILWELQENKCYLYYNDAALSYCQPAGEYCVGVIAVDGLDMWSDYLFNCFWYIPTAAVYLDFKTVIYGDNEQVVECIWADRSGDKDIDTPSLPTVKNVGNVPVFFTIEQDDMGFYKTGGPYGTWNVEYQARLNVDGKYSEIYPPEKEIVIPGYLGMCTEDKLDFYIHVIKGLPGVKYTGKMWLTAHIAWEQVWDSPMTFDPITGIPAIIDCPVNCPCVVETPPAP